MNHFIMPKTEGLSVMEEAVLLVISRKGEDKDGWRHICREAIANKINANEENIKMYRTISKHTKTLVEKGYLEKKDNYDGTRNLVKYKVKTDKYRVLGNPMYSLDIRLLVFLGRLSDYCWNNTNKVLLSNTTLIKNVKIRKADYYKYLQKSIDLGILKKIEGGYEFNSYWMPMKNGISKPTKEHIDTMNQIATVDSKIGHCAKWFLENNIFEQDNWEDLYNKVLSGTLVCEKEDEETKYPDNYAMD